MSNPAKSDIRGPSQIHIQRAAARWVRDRKYETDATDLPGLRKYVEREVADAKI